MLLPFSTQTVLGLYGYIIFPFYPYILPFKPGKVAIRTNNPNLSLVGKNSIESHLTYLEKNEACEQMLEAASPQARALFESGPSIVSTSEWHRSAQVMQAGTS